MPSKLVIRLLIVLALSLRCFSASENFLLYVGNSRGDDVSVVDLATNTVTKKVKGGTGPWGVIVLPR